MRTYLLKEEHDGKVRTIWAATTKREIEKYFRIARKCTKFAYGLTIDDRSGCYYKACYYGSIIEGWIEIA